MKRGRRRRTASPIIAVRVAHVCGLVAAPCVTRLSGRIARFVPIARLVPIAVLVVIAVVVPIAVLVVIAVAAEVVAAGVIAAVPVAAGPVAPGPVAPGLVALGCARRVTAGRGAPCQPPARR